MKSRSAELERRAQRAEDLARDSTAAEAPLWFAAGLFRAQSAMADLLARAPLVARLEEDAERIVKASAKLLVFAAGEGPGPLREEARARRKEDTAQARARLLAYLHGEYDFLSRAVLRPYMEMLLAAGTPLLDLPLAPANGRCPFCGGAPWISARRNTPHSDGHGAERALSCARCGMEWVVNRIFCPACGETDPTRLPSFQGERFAAVRIEACETCRLYVKSLDLTLDARPIVEVDELLSLSMDLWAVEQGFTRIEPGLAGL